MAHTGVYDYDNEKRHEAGGAYFKFAGVGIIASKSSAYGLHVSAWMAAR